MAEDGDWVGLGQYAFLIGESRRWTQASQVRKRATKKPLDRVK